MALEQFYNVWNLRANRWTNARGYDELNPPPLSKEDADGLAAELNAMSNRVEYEARLLVIIETDGYNVWNIAYNRWTDWDQLPSEPRSLTLDEAKQLLNRISGGLKNSNYEVRSLNYQQKVDSGVAVNDAICPTCKNDRVSSKEKSCWKCGNPL